MNHFHDDKIKFLEEMAVKNTKTQKSVFAKASADKQKSAQDIFVRQAQDRQDDIFRKMPMEKKIELWANFWLLGKELEKNKQAYGNNRPAISSARRR